MNHPIIANENAKARYNEMLQDAATYRLQNKVAKPRGLVTLIMSLLFG